MPCGLIQIKATSRHKLRSFIFHQLPFLFFFLSHIHIPTSASEYLLLPPTELSIQRSISMTRPLAYNSCVPHLSKPDPKGSAFCSSLPAKKGLLTVAMQRFNARVPLTAPHSSGVYCFSLKKYSLSSCDRRNRTICSPNLARSKRRRRLNYLIWLSRLALPMT
jgi:hypothetical protein